MAVTSVQFAVAAHIMTILGFHYGVEVTSAALAESVQADPTFVRKSLSKLVKAGLVVATRGKKGACVLARPPEEITLRDIYLASEAPAAFAIHSYPAVSHCPVSANLQGCMAAVQSAAQCSLEQSLAKTTLADLVSEVRMRSDAKDCQIGDLSLPLPNPALLRTS